MAILDQSGGNASAQFEAKLHERKKVAYPWTCTNPGCPSPNQVGRIEEGCAACGSGADGIQAAPLPPTDFNCSACKGTGTVERKCGQCEGTGYEDAPQLGEPPPACGKCGGSGAIAIGCGRCEGSGIDPEPEQKAVLFMTADGIHSNDGEKTTMIAKAPAPAIPTPSAGIFTRPMGNTALPSIDDDGIVVGSDTVVRYRLLRYEGPKTYVDEIMERSLTGRWQEPRYDITAIEIAEPKSPTLKNALDTAPAPKWPAREKY